jgi:hypothetical protein
MEGRIGHLHCHYRILKGHGVSATPTTAQRLDALVRERASQVCFAALGDVLEGDTTVYVLREVRCKLGVARQAGEGIGVDGADGREAQRLGAGMAHSILRAIFEDTGDSQSLIKFKDQADFVASFLYDLLDRSAWTRWVYGAFNHLRLHDTETVVHRVLSENDASLPQILAYLHERRALGDLLAAANAQTIRSILFRRNTGGFLGAESVRPFFAGAVGLIDQLGTWVRSRPGPELLQDYAESDPPQPDWHSMQGLSGSLWHALRFLVERGYAMLPDSEDAELRSRLRTALQSLDWLDVDKLEELFLLAVERESSRISRVNEEQMLSLRALWLNEVMPLARRLGAWTHDESDEHLLLDFVGVRGTMSTGVSNAEQVANMLRFLVRQGYLRYDEQVTGAELKSRIDSSLVGWGWPDSALLRTTILSLFTPNGEPQATGLPGRLPLSNLTPYQRDLLADLEVVLRSGSLRLDLSSENDANDLKLYAALVALNSRWAGDPLTLNIVQQLLAGWQAIGKSNSPNTVLDNLERGDLEGALASLPVSERRVSSPGLKLVAQSGVAGTRLIKLLPGLNRGSVSSAQQGAWVETRCAGAFLLVRALMDARLPWLVSQAAYPGGGDSGLGAVLTALGLRWSAGMDANAAQGPLERVDPGLLIMAGWGSREYQEMAQLRSLWSGTLPADATRLQVALLRLLAGQSFLRGQVLHLYIVNTTGYTTLVGGDGASGMWPLGYTLNNPRAEDRVAEILAEWLRSWQEVSGYHPQLIVCDSAVPGADTLADRLSMPAMSLAIVRDAEDTPSELDDRDSFSSQHRAKRQALIAALRAVGLTDTTEEHRRYLLNTPDSDLTTGLLAIALLRMWARWLPQLADSSAPYLLRNFIHRAGRVQVSPGVISVAMEPRPLDVVLEMAGYLADLERVPWLGDRSLRFEIRG